MLLGNETLASGRKGISRGPHTLCCDKKSSGKQQCYRFPRLSGAIAAFGRFEIPPESATARIRNADEVHMDPEFEPVH